MKLSIKSAFKIVFLFISTFSFAQTYVSGYISSNTTWDLAGSPYIVTGNILVSNGVTLNIEPSVEIRLDQDKAIQIDGELIAKGNPSNHITFTSNQTTPTAGDWAKIHFPDSSTDAIFDINGNYVSGSILKYCDVLYGGGLGYGQIHIVNSSPYFNNCNFTNSQSNGIHCDGASYILDSCLIGNSSGYGLYFNQIQITSCGLTIRNNNIENNQGGGIYIDNGDPGCNTIISKNYFYGNTGNGALHFYGYSNQYIDITENTFLSNSTTNGAGAAIYLKGGYSSIEENLFENNYASGSDNCIVYLSGYTNTVSCNRFLSNETTLNGKGALYMNGAASEVRNNIFEENTNNTAFGVAVTDVTGSTGTHTNFFTDNTIRNNSATNGSCCKFSQDLYGQPYMNINYNNFASNMAKYTIVFSAFNSSSYNFLYFKYNNLLNPYALYEIYNEIAYGVQDIHIDSNYWGEDVTNQHIDSVIYDYFDDANKTVAYYSPVLITEIEVDTGCIPQIITINTELPVNNRINALVFPNPFTESAKLTFSQKLDAAEFRLYNAFGQLIKVQNNIYGKEFILNRQDMNSGIYIYTIADKQNKKITGRIMIY